MGAALVPVDRPGVEIMNNWDGLGMRASGSHDVIFTDYFVKDEEFTDIGAVSYTHLTLPTILLV